MVSPEPNFWIHAVSHFCCITILVLPTDPFEIVCRGCQNSKGGACEREVEVEEQTYR